MSEHEELLRKLEELDLIEVEGDNVRLTRLVPNLLEKEMPSLARTLALLQLLGVIEDRDDITMVMAITVLRARLEELGREVEREEAAELASALAVILDEFAGEEGRERLEFLLRAGKMIINNFWGRIGD